MIYVRFVGANRDRDSGRREGIFQIGESLTKSNTLSKAEAAHLLELEAWFDKHLKKPSRFARARRPHAKAVAISWFKPAAQLHIARVREMQMLLEQHGHAIEMIKTKRPGYVVYEDDFQITAYPFGDTLP